MKFSKIQKRLAIFFGILLIIIIGVILSLNLIIATILRAKINTALEHNKTAYKITLGGVGGNIFFGNIRFREITIKPDSSLFQHLKEGTSMEYMAVDAEIPLIRLTGFGLYNAIVSKDIDIGKIEIRDANIRLFRGGGKAANAANAEKKTEHRAAFNPDSIYLKNVSGFRIGTIQLTDNTIELFDVNEDESILKNLFSRLRLTGLDVKKKPDSEDVFYVASDHLKLEIEDEEFDLPGGDYRLFFKDMEFNMSDTTLIISDLIFTPTEPDRLNIAAKYKYTREIFDVSVVRIELHAFQVSRFLRESAVYLDSVDIYKLHLDILKDKRYPFDESARPKLIHQSLREMEMPLYIGNAQIHESYLVYQEKEEGAKELMTVSLEELEVFVDFITSVKDSTRTGRPMRINLNAKLMGVPRLKVDIVAPLNSRVDTFYFAGSLMGPAKLKIFNKASLPAIGAKFAGGELSSITFKGSANRTNSLGEMTMLYSDLNGELVKKDQKSTNKFLSWAANVVLRTSNPNNKGNTRVALMQFDRVMYKGFGNFLWKTLQSGIVNTVSPTGKQLKEENTSKSKASPAASSKNTKANDAGQEDKAKEKKRKKKK